MSELYGRNRCRSAGWQWALGLLILLLLGGCSSNNTIPNATVNHEYPIADHYAATVIGTPMAYRAEVPVSVPVKEYTLPSLHKVPDVFWYSRGLRFSAALQSGRAPLVFNIGGTGAGYKSEKMVTLQKALHAAGFHVINLSSPTHQNFLINASGSNLPGFLPDDAEDIYRVMEQAYKLVKADIEVSDFHVMGYSLGAAHAAFVAKLDQSRKQFGIKKVYMINPPVSLYNSVGILDRMLEKNVANGVEGVPVFLDRAINRLAASYNPKGGMRFDGDYLYNAYSSWDPNDRGKDDQGRSGAAALIAIAFRLTSGGMVFTSDLMTKSGYIIPQDKVFKRREPLNYYARASHIVTFVEYVNDLVIPYLKTKYPNKTHEQFIREASLYHIEGFLADYPHVRVVTNRDEIILAPGELDYMEKLFGKRIHVFGHGGHCGNIDSKENVDDMIAFLQGRGNGTAGKGEPL
jgi:pimeloyl-ACP methyl ester carboxylesterase